MDKKWNLQDIKTTSNKTRPTPPPNPQQTVNPSQPAPERAQSSTAAYSQHEPTPAESTSSQTSRRPVTSTKKRRLPWKWGIIGLVLLLVIVFVVGQFTAKTDLMVQPRTENPNLNSDFTAYTNPESGQLGYELLTIEAEGERQVTSSGETEEVSLPAEGVITINKTTSGTQPLVATTRFEDPNGNIFRIVEEVTVPGGTSENPGSVTVAVAADEAGAEGNVAAGTRFTVPGLESDTELFNAITATNAEPFTGGFEGVRVVVDEEELTEAQASIRTELESALRGRLPTEQPADFVSFAGAETFAYESLPATESASGEASVKEKVKLEIPIFQKDTFASFIASALVPGYEGGAVRIENIDTISFAYTGSSSEAAILSDKDSISFSLEGRPLLVWEYDETTLKTDLLGASQNSLTNILGAYPAIEGARATFAPFWKKSFPDSAAKITITEVFDLPE
jgi:hypothetical protein